MTLASVLTHPWDGYTPTETTAAFHQSEAKHRYIRAASQSGKTMAGAREAWMYAGDCHPYRLVPRSAKYGIIAVGSLEGTSYTGVVNALWDTRPHHLIDWSRTRWAGRGSKVVNDTIWMKNGSAIRIVSSIGGSTGAASVQADWVWIDEPPKRDKFSELIARTTQTMGHVWLTFTPFDSVQDLTWLKLYLEGDPQRGVPPEAPGWVGYTMELNRVNCPWMQQSQVDEMYRDTPVWVADQRLKGAWDTPPANAYFCMDHSAHDVSVQFETEGCRVGPWHQVASADHGELAGHQHVVFSLVRKLIPQVGVPFAQAAAVAEYVSSERSSFEADAVGIRKTLDLLGQSCDWLPRNRLRDPATWSWVGDVNTAGKGMAGVTANEALAMALGLRRDAFRTPDKGAGSVSAGTVALKAALDTRPCQVRVASGSTGLVGAPVLWRALTRHRGVDDATKHAVDAWRYGIVEYLEPGSVPVRDLPSPERVNPYSNIAAAR